MHEADAARASAHPALQVQFRFDTSGWAVAGVIAPEKRQSAAQKSAGFR